MVNIGPVYRLVKQPNSRQLIEQRLYVFVSGALKSSAKVAPVSPNRISLR
jgi:hypothetical protein